jgi:hypothetical protein
MLPSRRRGRVAARAGAFVVGLQGKAPAQEAPDAPLAGDGAEARARERLDFDVLAFESGLFDCSVAEARSADGESDALAAAEEGVFAIWTRSEQCRPLFEYVRATPSTPRPGSDRRP